MEDPISPSYYRGSIETTDYIIGHNLSYPAGCVIKYVTRHLRKGNPLQDLLKARWYLNKMIEELEKNEKDNDITDNDHFNTRCMGM